MASKLTHVEQALKTVYKRQLPVDLISFSSNQGKKLFKESLSQGTMENYFSLAEQYTTQSEPEYCGPASLIMVLNALNIDPNRPWKGIWRWFSEEILHCTTSEIMKQGMNLEQITQLARCNGLHTMTFRPFFESPSQKFEYLDKNLLEHKHNEHTDQNDSCCAIDMHRHSISETKDHAFDSTKLLHHNTSTAFVSRCDFDLLKTAVLASSRRQGLHSIANISRKTLQQTGDGHFTPIGGFNEQQGKVLLFDTARFKYPPHWIDLSLLYQALCTQDSESKRLRGFIMVSKKRRIGEFSSKICSIQVDYRAIQRTAKILCSSFREVNLKQYFEIYANDGLDNLQHKLQFLALQLNDQEIRTILFVYLHELVNRFSNESIAPLLEQDRDKFHLSSDFNLLLFQIRATKVYQLLLERQPYFHSCEFLRFLDYFLPDHSLEMFTLILLSLPKQVFYQLRMIQNGSHLDKQFWDSVIEENACQGLQEEIGLLKFHMGIQSEYCHISNYQAQMSDTEHSFYHGMSKKQVHY